MAAKTITIPVTMYLPTFRRFAVFDNILLRRRYASPLTFAVIMMCFAFVCFLSGKEQSALLGWVLTLIGLGMPITYFGAFFFQLRAQAKKRKLPQKVYTLTLSKMGVHIVNDMQEEPAVSLDWDKLHAAFKRKDAIYLYAAPSRAFILPQGQGSASLDEIWTYLTTHMPKGRTLMRIPKVKR